MQVSGWGNYPKSSARILYPESLDDMLKILANNDNNPMISRGMGRSYGDSSLAGNIVSNVKLKYRVDFNPNEGIVCCSSGYTLKDILGLYEPLGWFLPVTPGTKYVTIGGAVASDVHGKNHHVSGSFTDYVSSIKLLTVTNGVIECSRHHNYELFRATCGGMGLTGIILEVKFKLFKINSSFISQKTYKCENLKETLELLQENKNYEYSVAWVDCMATGTNLGRSIVTFGEHANNGIFASKSENTWNIPFNVPNFFLNKHLVNAFNRLYYSSNAKKPKTQNIHYDSFFYPLDKINNWNRLYGSNGLVQYQFVIPNENSRSIVEEILSFAAQSSMNSYLAVLKELGPANENYLSFPKKGVTLAMDFKVNKKLFPFLNHLDSIISCNGGKVYLAKDARITETAFKRGYPEWQQFRRVREKYGAHTVFHSLQSRRIGL